MIIAIGTIKVLSATMSWDARGLDEPAKRTVMASVVPDPTILATNEAITTSFQRIRLCSSNNDQVGRILEKSFQLLSTPTGCGQE